MDIYECTNQRQPLPGFNAIRIDYIDSGRRRNLVDRPCGTAPSSFRSLGRPFRSFEGIGNQRQIVSKVQSWRAARAAPFLRGQARNGTEEGSYFLLSDVFTFQQLRPILRGVCNLAKFDILSVLRSNRYFTAENRDFSSLDSRIVRTAVSSTANRFSIFASRGRRTLIPPPTPPRSGTFPYLALVEGTKGGRSTELMSDLRVLGLGARVT